MNFKCLKYTRILMLLLLVPFIAVQAGPDKKDRDTGKIKKVTGQPSYKRFNINNISTFIKNDGESDINPSGGNSGFTFPKGSNRQAIFQSGFLWGGRVGDQIRVGGSVYRQGTVPGKILNSGLPTNQLQAEDPNAANVRNYRVRPDIIPAGGPRPPSYSSDDIDVSSEVADGEEGGNRDAIIAEYERDWNEWPAADGAPYTDVDGNGSYSPAVDIPGVPGADQTIWFVANDLDAGETDFMYGSPPMGIEEQVTIWGYNTTGALGNMMFRRFKIINKSDTPFEDMYVSMWNDPDNGNAGDDYVGCDTLLSMTFCYNGKANDTQYGNYPPATGFDFFQGPLVAGVAGQDLNKNGIDDAEDSGQTGGRVVQGMVNLPMTAHYFFINSDPIYSDPDQGEYSGTLQFYNLFQGKVSTTGETFTDPTTGEPTTYALAGDPQTQQGWVDGLLHPADDRRAGMVSGPFTMAPGDTQEVVVAEIAAGAFEPVDRIGAVGLLKFYDLEAQLAYDSFFDVPKAPSAPQVTATELDQEIVLKWDDNVANVEATENYDNKGFTFQGYVVYQLPSASAGLEEAQIVATFDKVDLVGKIEGLQFDTETGVVGTRVLKFGSDAGVQRYISIKRDLFNGGLPLVNGTRYYFAVTSYAYNPDPDAVPNILENPLNVVASPSGQYVTPHSPDPGDEISSETGETLDVDHTSGTANVTVNVNVVDPSKLTGHEYEIFFDQQHYYLASDGQWKTTNFPDSIGKVGDVSPSSLSAFGVYGEAGTIDLNFTLDLVSPTDSWVDGITLTFPAGVNIENAQIVHAGGGDVEPVVNGNVITYGLVNGELTEDGVFHGDEVITVTVSAFTPPLSVDYIIHDDGFDGGDPTDPINAEGTATVTEIGNYFVTQNHWNVRDKTTGEVKVQDQTIINETDIYADVLGPGGSSGPLGATVPVQSMPVFDGLQANIASGTYEAPINYFSVTLERGPGSTTTLSRTAGVNTNAIVLVNYTVFGGTVTSTAYDNFGGIGTQVIEELQQDYELRFTGVLDTSVNANGDTLIQTISGGQMATIFRGVNAAALGTHPLNPNPGVNEPFLIRIPFEVWNVADPNNPYQVNLTFRDREAQPAAGSQVFRTWNLVNRVYAIIVNSPYNPNQVIQVDGGPDEFNAAATWVLVFYSTKYSLGDKIDVVYANPIQLGVDTYTFVAPDAPSYTVEAAKEDVKEINVFPNPYYGVNPQEINKYQRFVTINHLPERATIRIFNLAGQLVRTIEKSSSNQFERWDLLTESALPVPSGLYIIYVDMPELGETKVLKAAIIQEEQILDRF